MTTDSRGDEGFEGEIADFGDALKTIVESLTVRHCSSSFPTLPERLGAARSTPLPWYSFEPIGTETSGGSMAAVELYVYSNCSSCTKASVLVSSLGVDAIRRDLFKERLSVEELRSLFDRVGLSPRDVLSTRSRPYTEFGLAKRILDDDEILELMAHYPALVRRPIVVKGDRAVVGLDQCKIEVLLAS